MSDDDQAEASRLRRTKRLLILSVAAVGLFALALAAVYALAPRSSQPQPQPSPSPSPTPTSPTRPRQQTVLIQATTGDGALGNVLTAYADDPAASAVLLAVPYDLVVAAPGVAAQPLSQTVASLDTLRSASCVAATLGVRVDASWRLDRKALAGLVDSVSGITVTVPERTRVRDGDGEVVLSLRPGRQRLSGTAAAWYAVGQVPDQSDLAAAARFDEVLLRTLARLPDSDLAIRESLTALGALGASTIPTQDLAIYLHDLSTAVRSGAMTRGIVPSTQIALGTVSTDEGVTTELAYRWTDYRDAAPLIRDVLADALWQADVQGPPRVLVMADPGQPGLIGYAESVLTDADFVAVDGRGTRHAEPKRSRVSARANRQWGAEAAAALGIPDGRVEVVPAAAGGPPWADVDVLLGTRWVPGEGE